MRSIVWVTTALVVILIGAPQNVAQAVTFPTLYDDFHGTQIDPDRWGASFANGYEINRGLDPTVGRLMTSVQAYGNLGSGPLLRGAGRNPLWMVPPAAAAVRGIQVTTRIEDINVTGCNAPEPGRARADIYPQLFRDGPTPPNPNDWTGIVEAAIQVVVRAHQPDQTVATVNFFADRCLDFNCDTYDDLGGGSFTNVPLGWMPPLASS